jgi:type IV secretory pathway TrbD component
MANDVRARPRARRRAASELPGGAAPQASRGLFRRLTAGGTEGNERLTVITGLLLIVLLAALGITIINLGGLLWLHLFLGLLLIGPVALKMASAGYRFMRYYTHNRRYRVKGPPLPALRLLAPLVVALTAVVFISGVVLLFIGPDSSLRSDVFLIHKVSFFGWLAVTALHVLGHLPEIFRFLRISNDSRAEMIAVRSSRPRGSAEPVEPSLAQHLPGGAGRWLSISTALVLGLVLAVVLIPQFSAWTGSAGAAVLHHHHHLHH